MALIVYAFFLFGSFPAGYLLLRTGFPLTQKLNATKKLALSYIIGGLIFGAPIIALQYLEINPNYYMLLSLGLLIAFFVVMLTKRIALGETDPFTFQKEKKKSLQIPSKLKEEKAAEKQKPIVFEQGLMVKTKEDTKGKQVFKEKENNIQSTAPAKSNEKNEALERLRKFAQEIKKNPQKSKGGPEEIEEDLLSNLSDEDTKEEEEEY